MALLGKLFGGGTKLELKLDANQIPEGGILSGTVFLTGGKKPLTVTDLKVRLVYVKVTTVPNQSMPKIELKVLIDNTLTSNQALEPGSLTKYAFTLGVPKGTDPKGSYKVMAVADIPGVLDPKAEADLKVTPAVERGFFGFAKGPAAADAETLFKEFPGLQSTNENELRDALGDLESAAYDPEKNLVAAEPILARIMREGSPRLKQQALRCWGTVLNNRARPEHIKTLEALAADPALTERELFALTEVAAKFAEEGALPVVQRLAKHPAAPVRAQLATHLYLNADKKLKERKTLLLELSNDAAPEVRAAALRAFGDFYTSDKSMVQRVADALAKDAAPEVKAAALQTISWAAHYASVDVVYAAVLPHVTSPFLEVRQTLADQVSSLPDDPRLDGIVKALLADAEVAVRRRMAWQSCNLGEFQRLAPLFAAAATADAAVEVRGDALQGLTRLMPLDQALALYAERLAKDQAEVVYWGVVNGLREVKQEPAARAMLEQVASSRTYSEPARVARDILSE